MKKAYETPKAEIVCLDQTDIITASTCNDGNTYQVYTANYSGCRETPTDQWVGSIF